MGPMPLTPSSAFAQNSLTLLPIGERTLMPVMTTRGRRGRVTNAISAKGWGKNRSSNSWSNITGWMTGWGSLCTRGDSRADGFENICFNGAFGGSHGVLDGYRIRPTVSNNDDAVHPEQRRTAILGIIQDFFHLLECRHGKRAANHGDWIAFDFGFDQFIQHFGNAFGGLERDIADKAITNHDIGEMRGNVFTFNIANEIQSRFGGALSQ